MSAKRKRSFAAAVDKERAKVFEYLQLFGDMPEVTAKDAIVEDWTHVLMITVTDVIEETRKLSGEESEFARKMLRKQLARVVAVAEAWERRV